MTLDNISNHIYVINLKERTDRKEHITIQLKNVNCNNYVIFEGVNGNTVTNPTRLKNGMYGLVNTYLNIYNDWINKSPNDILIIEDDCVFNENFNNMLSEYISNIPNDWDMIYFGGNHNYHMGNKTQKINNHCIKLNNTYSAHCVLLKNYVFEELINSIKSFTIENDVMLGSLQKKYNSYSPIIGMTTQIPGFSNIENTMTDYRWLIK